MCNMGEFEEKNTNEDYPDSPEEEGEVQPEPRISKIAGILVICYAALLDLVGMIIVFLALDDLLILDVLGAPLNLYFWFIGVNATRSTITTLLELVPYVGALPLKTIGVAMTVWIERHPESKMAMAVNAAAALKGADASSGKQGAQVAGENSGFKYATAGSIQKISYSPNKETQESGAQGGSSGKKKFGTGASNEAEQNESPDGGSSQKKKDATSGVGEQYGVGSEKGEAKKFIPEEAKGAGTEDNELLEKVAENAAQDSPYATPDISSPIASISTEESPKKNKNEQQAQPAKSQNQSSRSYDPSGDGAYPSFMRKTPEAPKNINDRMRELDNLKRTYETLYPYSEQEKDPKKKALFEERWKEIYEEKRELMKRQMKES